MGRVTKGMTLIEVMMVILILSIMSSLAMPMYADYTKKSRTAEVPMVLKSLAQTQIGFYEEQGHYAAELLTLGWKTNNGLFPGDNNRSDGAFFSFSTADDAGCDPGAGWAPVPIGLALAVALEPLTVPPDQQAACMNAKLEYQTNR